MVEPLTDKELEEMRRRTEDLGELLYGGVRKATLRLFATLDALRTRWDDLEAENTRLQIRAGEAEAQRKEAQTGRDNVHAYCKLIEGELDALKEQEGKA